MTHYLTLMAMRALMARDPSCTIACEHDWQGCIRVYTAEANPTKGIHPAQIKLVTFDQLVADGLIAPGPGHLCANDDGSNPATIYRNAKRKS